MAIMNAMIAIMISKKRCNGYALVAVLKGNCFKIRAKEIRHSRAGFLPNLEASHCQPIYEANQSIRSHPFRGVNDHICRVFTKPGSQRKF